MLTPSCASCSYGCDTGMTETIEEALLAGSPCYDVLLWMCQNLKGTTAVSKDYERLGSQILSNEECFRQ